MKKLLLTISIFTTLLGCSNNEPIFIENLSINNGIYMLTDKKIHTGVAITYFPKSKKIAKTIDCFLVADVQRCITEDFYENGTVHTKGEIRNGIQHGEWEIHNQESELLVRERYVNGKKEGFVEYYQEGLLHTEIEYKNNKAHGIQRTYYTREELLVEHAKKLLPTTAEGIQNILEVHSGEKGIPQFPTIIAIRKEEGRVLQGKKEGEWRTFSVQGTMLTKSFYISGNLEGEAFTYYANGQIKERGIYKNGVKEGEWRSYHENGQLQTQRFFKKGVQEGIEKNYHKNARLQDTIIYKNGVVQGVVNSYDEQGRLERTTFYDTSS